VVKSKGCVVKNSKRDQLLAEPCAMRTPNDHDLGVLVSLAAAARRFGIGRGREFVRPMDIGGSARRHISASLARLEKYHFVLSRPRALKYSAILYPSRVTLEYKITEAGLVAAQNFDSRVNASITCSHIEKDYKRRAGKTSQSESASVAAAAAILDRAAGTVAVAKLPEDVLRRALGKKEQANVTAKAVATERSPPEKSGDEPSEK
jgi:hypothetical protein